MLLPVLGGAAHPAVSVRHGIAALLPQRSQPHVRLREQPHQLHPVPHRALLDHVMLQGQRLLRPRPADHQLHVRAHTGEQRILKISRSRMPAAGASPSLRIHPVSAAAIRPYATTLPKHPLHQDLHRYQVPLKEPHPTTMAAPTLPYRGPRTPLKPRIMPLPPPTLPPPTTSQNDLSLLRTSPAVPSSKC